MFFKCIFLFEINVYINFKMVHEIIILCNKKECGKYAYVYVLSFINSMCMDEFHVKIRSVRAYVCYLIYSKLSNKFTYVASYFVPINPRLQWRISKHFPLADPQSGYFFGPRTNIFMELLKKKCLKKYFKMQ